MSLLLLVYILHRLIPGVRLNGVGSMLRLIPGIFSFQEQLVLLFIWCITWSYHVASSACLHTTQINPCGQTKRLGATVKTYPLNKTKQFGGDVLDKVLG